MEREALKLARQLLWRYRHETPIGHQPYMICHEADEAFERIDKALAQPVQEPVAFLDWYENAIWGNEDFQDGCHRAWDAALEHTTPPQPAQEPVAWMIYTQDGQSVYVTDNPTDIQEGQRALPLYTTPPQREWVGLTDPDFCHQINTRDFLAGAFFAEAKLKDKNT